MPRRITKKALTAQMKSVFPDRWEVAQLESRADGDRIVGAIKIHCLEDDKLFLSDFAAKIDRAGRLSDLTLDGVHIGKFVGRLHQKP